MAGQAALGPGLDQDDAEFFSERGFGGRVGFGARPALVVVDFINAFTDPASPLGAPLADELDFGCKVLSAARNAHIPRLFTTVSYADADLKEAGVWARKMKGLTVLRAGTHSVQVDDRLGRCASETLIVKRYASSFFGTDLQFRLASAHVDTVIIIGCTTSGCVRATAVDAVQLGYRPIVAREAVGDRSSSAHIQALFDLDQKYADVESVDSIVQRLHALPPKD